MIDLRQVNFDDAHTKQDFLMCFPLVYPISCESTLVSSVTAMIRIHRMFESISYAKSVCSRKVL